MKTTIPTIPQNLRPRRGRHAPTTPMGWVINGRLVA